MTERVTLELSDTTVQRARETARQMNRSLEEILAEWLERASEIAGISPLDPNVTYHIYTPFGADATAQSLLEMLRDNDTTKGDTDVDNHAI